MSNEIVFEIDDIRSIIIYLQGEEDIYEFDEISIIYKEHQSELCLFNDYAIEGIKVFKEVLEKVLKGILQLDRALMEKGVGYWWNEWLHNLTEKTTNVVEDISAKHNLWSTISIIGIETWMYNIDNSIYLEISPNYKWHTQEPPENEECISYDKFIKEYKPLKIIKMERGIVEKWHEKCLSLFKRITK